MRPPATVADIARLVDDEVLGFLAAVRSSVEPDAVLLVDEIVRLIGAGGKRLRPVFCHWGHLAAGGEAGPAIARASSSLELLHTFAIVHDDVMDDSPLRRGRPSSHRALGATSGDASFGRSVAILVGDLALVLADRMLAGSGFPAERLAAATRVYDEMRVQAITGQYLDLASGRAGEVDEAHARRVARLKSGGYTVRFPLAVGAELAGATPAVRASLDAYGLPLGEAFQIRDDVLGLFGDPDTTGKDRDSDLREGKQTVLVAKARSLGGPAAQRVLGRVLGNRSLTEKDASAVRDVVRSSGALDATVALLSSMAQDAVAALDCSVLEPAAVVALTDLAALVALRDA